MRLWFDPDHLRMGNDITFGRCTNLGGTPVEIQDGDRLLCIQVNHDHKVNPDWA